MSVVLSEFNNEPVVPHSDGDDWEIRCGLTFSGEYKTGGDSTFKEVVEAVLKELGTGIINFVIINGVPGYFIQYNYKTGKLQVFWSGASGAVLKELTEAEYPAAIREAGIVRALIAGR